MRIGWQSGLVHWQVGDTIYISVVFSWQKQEAFQKCVWYRSQGYIVKVGGPAYDKDFFYMADSGDYQDAVRFHNPDATFTSRGCIRKCPFCIVPKIEGDLRELDDWPVRPVVCDNNLLACSLSHFDQVVDKLKPLKDVDFNQGLDVRLLTKRHAERIRELDLSVIRLAWDNTKIESRFLKTFQTLIDAGFPPSRVRVYVLIGFDDTPEDALYRLRRVRELKALPNPMRYQPVNAEIKNVYVGDNWNDRLLKHYMRYWARLRFTSPIPFEEFKSPNGLVASEMM